MKLCLPKGALRPLVMTGVAASVAMLAACSGPATGSGSPAPSASDVMPGTTMPEPAGASQAAPVAANAVTIENLAFVAPSITVKVGATVTWTNNDEDPHTVTATGGAFRSPTMTTGATFTHTFTAPGSVDYVCTIHPFMHGTVVVTP